MSEMNEVLLEAEIEDTSAQSATGVYLQLADGRQTLAAVNPQAINRILSVLSMDEFNQFVDVIVRSVENPDDATICQC